MAGRTLITGATGFLGRTLLAHMKAAGGDVVAAGRDPVKCAEFGAAGTPCVAMDLGEMTPQDWATFGDVNQIVHCAALSSPFGRSADFMHANVAATRNLIAFAQAQGVTRFIYISTSSVCFTYKDRLNIHEDDPLPRPVNTYAKTKRMAEDIVLSAHAIGPIVLRPRGIYGPGDTALLPRLIRVATQRPLPVFRDGAAKIDLTYVSDVVSAIMAACESDQSGEVFNISGGEVLPIHDIVNQVSARAGITVAWRRQPLGLAIAVAQVLEGIARLDPLKREPLVTKYGLGLFAYEQGLNIEKARDRLGWTPTVCFADGLNRTFSP